MENVEYIRGVLLLVLIIGSNFLADTFPCESYNFLKTNKIAKYTILFFLIFFTINFTNPIGINPRRHIYNAIILLLLYIIITQLKLVYMIICLCIIASIYIIQTYIDYHKLNTKDKNMVYKLSQLQNSIKYILLIVIGIGIIDWQYRKNMDTELVCDRLV
jgi:hypothetical protein